MSWLECVPNVSEGRRQDVIRACADAIRAHAALLDVTSDPAHNRSVFTCAGVADALRAAAFALFDVAVAAIDLRRHAGEHPRVGAVDVMPFVPLGNTPMADAVRLARDVAQGIAERCSIPVYLYEDASPAGRRRQLEQIRRGGLAGLLARMANPAWAPDFGPPLPHPTAGATVVGARRVLIAYNIELASREPAVAAAIARAVRESSGGLPAVKAIGVTLAGRGTVQVSMNLTDYRTTSIAQAFDAVASEAVRLGVPVLGSELVGLAPEAALTPEIAARVQLQDFDPDRMILERRLAAVRAASGA